MGMDSPIWVDVYSPAGVKQAVGPIVPISWRWRWQVDGAGDFEMELPLRDYKNSQLQQHSILKAYSIVAGFPGPQDRGQVVVERIERFLGPEGEELIRVSGGDILRQLAWIPCTLDGTGRLKIVEWRDPVDMTVSGTAHGAVCMIGDDIGTVDLPEAYDANPATVSDPIAMTPLGTEYTYLYIGFDKQFDIVNINLQTQGTSSPGCTLGGQGYDGETGQWVTLADFVDGTYTDRTMRQDGAISFTRPANWAKYRASKSMPEWYWIRLHTGAGTGNVADLTLAEVTLRAEMPTTDGINLIMANAPAGWVNAGYPATSQETFLEFSSEDSILTALIKLAEATGDHFMWIDGYEIDWLTSFSASNYIAHTGDDVRNLAQNAEALIIHSLTQIVDSAEAASLIIPYGAGIGGQRATLASCTLTDAGYTLDTALNTLQRDATQAVLGDIYKVVQFPNITEQDPESEYLDPEAASNALYRAAKEWLDRHAGSERFYELTYVPYNHNVVPGVTINAVAHRWKDNEHVLDVDTIRDAAPLYVMAVEVYADAGGEAPTLLEVGTTDRRPGGSDALGMAQLSTTVYAMQAMGLSGNLTQNITNLQGALGEQLEYNPANHGVPDDGVTSAVSAWAAFAAYTVPAGGGMAVCQGLYLIDDDLTIPANVAIEAFRGTRFSVSSTKTLTIERPVRAGRYQIFAGAGSVVLNGPAQVEWFHDGSADHAPAFRKAIAASRDVVAEGSAYTLGAGLGADTTIPIAVSGQKLTVVGDITSATDDGVALFTLNVGVSYATLRFLGKVSGKTGSKPATAEHFLRNLGASLNRVEVGTLQYFEKCFWFDPAAENSVFAEGRWRFEYVKSCKYLWHFDNFRAWDGGLQPNSEGQKIEGGYFSNCDYGIYIEDNINTRNCMLIATCDALTTAPWTCNFKEPGGKACGQWLILSYFWPVATLPLSPGNIVTNTQTGHITVYPHTDGYAGLDIRGANATRGLYLSGYEAWYYDSAAAAIRAPRHVLIEQTVSREQIDADNVANGGTFDGTAALSNESVYLLTMQVFTTANAVDAQGAYLVARKGTGSLITNIVAITNVAVSVVLNGSNYNVRITNNIGAGRYFRCGLLRLA